MDDMWIIAIQCQAIEQNIQPVIEAISKFDFKFRWIASGDNNGRRKDRSGGNVELEKEVKSSYEN